MTLAQIVALGTLPELATSTTPLADAAAVFLGAGGAALMTLRRDVSTSGNNMGQALSGSRNLFALAEQGDLPRVLRPRAPAVPHAGQRDPRHRGGRAGAGAVRPVRGAGGGERGQPPDRLRVHVRGDAPAAASAFAAQVRAGAFHRCPSGR